MLSMSFSITNNKKPEVPGMFK